MKPVTYAETLRKAMRAKGLNRRGLQRAMPYSYEHIRKIAAGLPLMSEKFNEDVCRALSLDPEEMWQLAVAEKRGSRGEVDAIGIPDDRLAERWRDLTAENQERLLVIAEGLAEKPFFHRAMRQERQFVQLSIEELCQTLVELATLLRTKLQEEKLAAAAARPARRPTVKVRRRKATA